MEINQSSLFLTDILRLLIKGSLLPAGFQRPYVWEKSDVTALVESVLQGFPIGGFLFWTPLDTVDLSRAARSRLGPIYPGNNVRWASLLLDGQNRLASLAWLLRDQDDPLPLDMTEHEQEVWAKGECFVADLATKKLLFVPVEEANIGFRLPMAALLNSKIANPLMRTRWSNEWANYSEDERNDGLIWFDKCADAFRSARIVVTDISRATADEAKNAFLHICKVGVPLSESDLNAALAWAL